MCPHHLVTLLLKTKAMDVSSSKASGLGFVCFVEVKSHPIGMVGNSSVHISQYGVRKKGGRERAALCTHC